MRVRCPHDISFASSLSGRPRVNLILRLMCDIPGQLELKVTFLTIYLSLFTPCVIISLSVPS